MTFFGETQRNWCTIMKISFSQLVIICLFTCMAHAGPGMAQRVLNRTVSISADKHSLSEVLLKMEREAGIKFVYSENVVETGRLVSVDTRRTTLRKVLDDLLTPYDISYHVINDRIVLSKMNKQPAPGPEAGEQPVQIQQRVIQGQVTDAETGEPLPGVSVMLKDSNIGTSTDEEGNYELTLPETVDEGVLVYSFIGYFSREAAIGGRQTVNVTLERDVAGLEEVVVIGYGQVQKRDLTGSVSSVRPDQFNAGIQISPDQLLQGRVPGVQITQVSGEPGAGTAVRIRGATSITAGNDPLYVIDGFPGAPLNALNARDIESVEVLKDASAAAIYGSRGANGVILITTKQGKAGAMRISYNGSFGVQEVAKKLDLMNGQQYMTFLNDINADRGQAPLFSQEEINAIGTGTDWQDEVLRAAPVQDHQFSLSGGSEDTRYYISLSHLNQQGIIIDNGIKRYSARVNLNHSTDRFNFGLNLNTSLVQDDNVPSSPTAINAGAGVITTAIQMDPVMPARNDDGSYAESTSLDLDNPVAQAETILNEAETNRTFGNVFAEYRLLDNLNVKLNLGSDRRTSRNDNYVTKDTKRGQNTNSSSTVSESIDASYLAELTMSYKKTLNEIHQIDAVAGYSYQAFTNRGFSASAQDFPGDAFGPNNLGAGNEETYGIGSGRSKNQLLSWLGRVNYSFRDKYLATASFRIDGSSRFGADHRYGYFPSLALAWRMSNEPFIADMNLFSDLKLRASYGVNGNQEGINNYAALILLGTSGEAVFGGSRRVGIAPAQLANPDLRWEQTEQFNIGLDYGFLGGRITGSVDYFIKKTSDLLLSLPIPSTSGFSSSLQNVGDTRNNGFEFMIDSRNLTGDFSWSTTFNLATIRNEVVNLGELPFIFQGGIRFLDDFAILRKGDPISSYYGYVVDGIFQTAEEVAGSAQPAASPGDLRFRDVNEDGTINPDDRTILGDPFPNITLGLNNHFSYKGFGLDLFFDGAYGQELLNFTRIDSEYPIEFRRNRQTYVLDRWTPDNPTSENPSYLNMNVARAINSRVVEDGSYLRLKNVMLRYNFPKLNLRGISSLSVYGIVQNVFMITDYTGFNPDVSVLGSGNVRVDYNAYPFSRIYTFGIDIGF